MKRWLSKLTLTGDPDFNFAPDDPAYSLLVGDPLLPDQEARLISSRVVHASVDPTIATTAKAISDEASGQEGSDPDKIITNARPATPADGLLSVAELVEMFSKLPLLRSAYDEGLERIATSDRPPTFDHRVPITSPRHGRNEPEYTSYTHYWKTVLGDFFLTSFLLILRELNYHRRLYFRFRPSGPSFKSCWPSVAPPNSRFQIRAPATRCLR